MIFSNFSPIFRKPKIVLHNSKFNYLFFFVFFSLFHFHVCFKIKDGFIEAARAAETLDCDACVVLADATLSFLL